MWDDVRRVAAELPGATEGPERVWCVRHNPFALERPLRRADQAFFGDGAPSRPDQLDEAELRELVVDAWPSCAPRTVARWWLEEPLPGPDLSP